MTAQDGQPVGALPELVVVDVRGDFDLAVADRPRKPLFEAIPETKSILAFDLSDCTHLDSVALGLIGDVHRMARGRSSAVVIICPDAPHPAIAPINMSALREIVSVFPSREGLHLFLGAFAGTSGMEVLTTSGRGSPARIS